MFNLFKKKADNKQEVKTAVASQDCDGDPDCPMCHVPATVVEQLKNKGEASTTESEN